ncbi:MAG: glycosyltransferase [Planctomycetes bacterium]|nr:glycosyltransferase [Planctomycetota bacterium]
MIWLASFPRSGSTFFRIVLDEVYGIESSTFHREAEYPVDEEYTKFPVVKTHLLPDDLVPSRASIPAVYLVRDGRDCVVSLAHYRKQLLAGDSDFDSNLLAAIEAAEGSYFGGWGEHVRRWTDRASLVIRFEELTADPIGCVERLRPWLDLPEPRVDRLPGFADLKAKDLKYGSGVQHGFKATERERWRKGKFRRGKAGSWQDELPARFHRRFLHLHGRELVRMGYVDRPACPSPDDVCRAAVARLWTSTGWRKKRKGAKRVLVDVSKLLDTRIDGIRRYVQELLRAMLPIADQRSETWKIDVRFGPSGTFPLLEVADDVRRGQPPLERIHRLFRTDNENPLHACKERLSKMAGRLDREVVRETMRMHYLKTCRSLQKRWRRLQQVKESVFPSEESPRYDLVHLTLPNTWEFYRDLDAPLLTTVHDLSHKACPQFQAASNNRSLAAGLRFAESVDSDYVADSQSTKDQMVELLGLDPERIAVVHLACDSERFQPIVRTDQFDRVRQKYGIPDGPYVLSLGTLEPRKNLINTVRAFALLTEEAPHLGANLVIAGSFGWGDAEELEEAIRACPRVQAIGYVDDRDLPALYSGAAAFSYVSYYEGFGLPLLEAMACGAATVYGNVSSMPEIVGDAGLSVSPDDVQEIKTRLRQLLEDEELRNRLSASAVVRSLDFSWEKVAEETFGCYEHFIEARAKSEGRGSRWFGGSAGRTAESVPMGGKHAAA